MKILYGIQTIGQGHINRSRTIIDQLIEDGHEVDCVLSGPNPPDYAKRIANRWIDAFGYQMILEGHRINVPKTFMANFINTKKLIKSITNIMRLANSQQYDAIFSDFELFTCLSGLTSKIPVIVVDHQHSLIHPSAMRAPGKFLDIFNVVCALGLTVPYFSHIFSLDFVNKPIRRFRETLFPLIWKKELNNYQVSVDNHYCVYLPYIKPEKIYYIFSKFPNNRFYVYGFNFNKKRENVVFKETSRTGFLKDMASSKGIIAHTGFSITWEIILLKKSFYTIPLDRHWEQQSNAYRLSNLNLAYVANDLTREDTENFLNYAGENDFKAHNDITVVKPSVLTKVIYKELDAYA